MNTKTLGIILAAGSSSRLYPATFPVTKQLLPIYDKPLFYYPLTTLMLAGVRDFFIIVSPQEREAWSKMMRQTGLDRYSGGMGEGAIRCNFVNQEKPTGIPDAFNLVAQHPTLIEGYDSIMLILGDNFFHGSALTGQIQNALAETSNTNQASIFAHKVTDLHRFGVINVSKKPYEIVEKPKKVDDEKNCYAIPGLYIFPKDVFFHAKELKPSERGETEITDLITFYRNCDRLNVEVLHRGVAWFDTGTPEALLAASQYVASVQHAQGFLIGSPHEVALKKKWIDPDDLYEWTKNKGKGDYVRHLIREMAQE